MLTNVSVDWWAILLAGVINMVLGTIWYSKPLFGTAWMKLMDIKEMKPNPATLLLMFIVALAIAYIMTYFVVWSGATSFWGGVEAGLLASLTFVALVGASSALASGTDWKLWGINSGYWVIALALMGGVLASIR